MRLFVNEPLLKKMPVFNGDQLKRTTLIVLYDEQKIAQDVVSKASSDLLNCQKQMGMDTR